jgi:hypothetical protein
MSRSALANLSETDLYDALFFANKAASIVCSRRGAEPPTLRELEALKMPAPKSKGSAKPAVKKPAASKTSANAKTAPAAKASKTAAKPAVKAKTPAKPAPKPAAGAKAKSGKKK